MREGPVRLSLAERVHGGDGVALFQAVLNKPLTLTDGSSLQTCGHDGRVLKSAGNDGKRLTPQHGRLDALLVCASHLPGFILVPIAHLTEPRILCAQKWINEEGNAPGALVKVWIPEKIPGPARRKATMWVASKKCSRLNRVDRSAHLTRGVVVTATKRFRNQSEENPALVLPRGHAH